MILQQLYTAFPTHKDCLRLLEEVYWGNTPTCPYCGSSNNKPILKENRYRCNGCNTTYSVTAKTIFHKTRCDLQKWFFAIPAVLDLTQHLSARDLAEQIDVTKDTAWYMANRIMGDKQNLQILSTKILNSIK